MKAITLVVLALSMSSCSWFRPKYTCGLEGQSLPDFSLMRSDSTQFNTASINKGQPFVLFLFEPNCHYCQAQTVDMLKNMQAIQNVRIFMITSYSNQWITAYSKYYHLDRYPNIVLERDSSNRMIKYFKTSGVPYLAFYDKDKILKKVLPGEQQFPIIEQVLAKL